MFLTALYEVVAFILPKYTKTSTLLSALYSSSYTFDEIEALGFKSGIFLKSTITGPTLKLEAYVKSDLDYKIGYLNAFIRPFPPGLFQLDTIQVLNRRQTLGFKREGWTING